MTTADRQSSSCWPTICDQPSIWLGNMAGRTFNHGSTSPQGRLSMTLVKSPSLFFSCCLAHPLSSNIGQVVVFIIRFMISPHYKNNLKPLRSQSSKRLRMTVPFSTLLPIGLVRPFTSSERVKRKPVDGMSQMLVTGKAKNYHVALATRLGYGNSARLGLKVSKGLPTIVGIAQLSPKLGDG